MQLHSLAKTTVSRNKRLGRGYGSGKGGHTSTRGQKGQNTRGKIPSHFIGTSWVWFKRLPFLRGKSRFTSLTDSVTITLDHLNALPAGSIVTPKFLYQSGLIRKYDLTHAKVKLVGTGRLEKNLTVELVATPGARKAVEKAGGNLREPQTK